LDDLFLLVATPEFEEWLNSLSTKDELAVRSRLKKIREDGHFGPTNYFDKMIELKWKSGLRVYLYRERNKIAVLYGGTKNGQEKDIKKARSLLLRGFNKV
jgi:putative addiction module killer protein